MNTKVIIGIGANLNNPLEQVKLALTEIAQIKNSKLLKCSSLYETKPVGPQDQPKFINAVAILETSLTALEFLDELQALENSHLRKRIIHWGPRTLDLDILFWGNEEINNERLIVPHKEFANRVFTVLPLLEIEPNFIYKGTPLKNLVSTLPQDDLDAFVKIK